MLTLLVSALSVTALAQAPTGDSPVPEPTVTVAAPSPLTADELRRINAALEVYFRAQDEPLAEEAAAGPPLVVSVGEAVDLAEEQNPQIDVAESNVAAARARTGQARAEKRPQVTGRGALTYVDTETPDFGGGGVFSRVAERFIGDIGGSSTTTTGQVGVRQIIFAGGQIDAAIRASEYLAHSEEWQREATSDQLELDTKEGFYNVLLARALESVAQESVTTFERHLTDAERMYDVGIISGFEVLRARTELGTRQSDRVAAENGVRLAKANLRRLLALPPDTPLLLEGGPELDPVTEPVGELIARANERRPELLALEQGILAAEQDVRRVKGQYWPRLAATGAYLQSDGGGGLFVSQDGLQATLGAEIDIYSGGRRKYQVVEARALLDNVRNQYEDVENLVALDVTRAYIQLQDAAAQVLSELGNVELAREGLRLSELRFQEGVGTQSETLDASLALTGAESAGVRALYNYALAHAALQKAIGDPPSATEATAPPVLPTPEPQQSAANNSPAPEAEPQPKDTPEKKSARKNFTFRKKK